MPAYNDLIRFFGKVYLDACKNFIGMESLLKSYFCRKIYCKCSFIINRLLVPFLKSPMAFVSKALTILQKFWNNFHRYEAFAKRCVGANGMQICAIYQAHGAQQCERIRIDFSVAHTVQHCRWVMQQFCKERPHYFLLTLLLMFTASCITTKLYASPPISPLRSISDQWQYRVLTLHNRLTVLLVTDPAADRAAAALDVHVGSGADPEDAQGLAHYVEHMLFLGTEKYPEADGFQHFLAQHGGNYNAYTAFEHTNYFFDIKAQQLPAALDRFADFFIAPLFPLSFSARERNVIDSEFVGGLRSDGRRAYALLKELVHPQHPLAKFSVGNRETLAGDAQVLQNQLQAFYRRYYSANLMTLVVYGPQNLDTLQQWVETRFSAIPDHDAELFVAQVPLFAAETLPLRVDYRPIKEIRSLTLSFPLPVQDDEWQDKSLVLLSHLIGHEGPGSLAAELKQRHWIERLSSGIFLRHADSQLFSINMMLTEDGAQQIGTIVAGVFAYLELLRDDEQLERYFAEFQQIGKQEFDYQQKRSPLEQVRHWADQLHETPPEQILAADYLFSVYDAQRVAEILAALQPHNVLLTIADPAVEGNQTEHFYGVSYRRAALPKIITETNFALQLPAPNPFIATDFTREEGTANPIPERLKIDAIEAWYRQDDRFQLPRADFYFHLRTPLAQRSARDAFMLRIYTEWLSEMLESHLYAATIAGFEYRLYATPRGLTVRLSGFDDKLALMLDRLLESFAITHFDPQIFARIKAQLLREFRNMDENDPLHQAWDRLQYALHPQLYSPTALLAAGTEIRYSDLDGARAEILTSGDLVSLAHGNLNRAQAEALNQQLLQRLPRNRLTVAPVTTLQLTERVSKQIITTPHPDSAVVFYLQFPNTDVHNQAQMHLLHALVQAPFFKQLRTEEELGYSVFASPYQLFLHPGMVFAVQSNRQTAEMLSARIARFISEFSVDDLSAEDLEQYQYGIAAKLRRKKASLEQQSDEYWKQIDLGEIDFIARERKARLIETFTIAEVRAAWRKLVHAPRLMVLADVQNSQ